jgi:hypothetical protein
MKKRRYYSKSRRYVRDFIRKWYSDPKEQLMRTIKEYDHFMDRNMDMDRMENYRGLSKMRYTAIWIYKKRFPETAVQDLITRRG